MQRQIIPGFRRELEGMTARSAYVYAGVCASRSVAGWNFLISVWEFMWLLRYVGLYIY